ncbi:MAG: TrkH family potassium uptake protein [Bacteroidales bacterium]|nr:TrkH family potassium uptake protein [Bacteroidales bacterium]
MNLKVISRNVGTALLVSALFMFLSIIVSMVNGNDSALSALIISFIITFSVGIFPFIFVKRTPNISLKEGYLIIVLSWVLSFIFGMLPYVLWGGPFTVVNAWFESVSGFTTTGATILENVEGLPRSLLFWRSSTHFIGGLGVMVFLLLIIPSSSPVKLRLSNMELSSLSKEGYRKQSNRIVYIFTIVYLAMNISSFILYRIAGMSTFDAINHAFSVSATGGFSTKNTSIGYFNSPAINLITILFMLMSSTHFGITYMIFATRSLKPLNNPVLKYYLGLLITFSIMVAMSLKFHGVAPTWDSAFMDAVFQVICYASTTGFAITDNSTWPIFPSVILVVAGMQCGMAGSTTGGLKSDRVLLLFKSIRRHLRMSVSPTSVLGIKMGKNMMKDEDVYPHVFYVAVFFLLAVASYLLLLLFCENDSNALSGTIATICNVGPGLGEIGSMGNYDLEPVPAKIIYTVNMLLGRLEIYPVMAVVLMILHPKSK